jgi:hypothetical protein
MTHLLLNIRVHLRPFDEIFPTNQFVHFRFAPIAVLFLFLE